MPFPSGTPISHYEVLELLGKGGMGEVYLARDNHLEREVALKFVTPDYAADEAWKRRFLREARTASRLTHPGVAVVYEAGEWQGHLFLAMECVRGVTLSARIKQGPLPFATVHDYALQLAEVLRAAHQQDIVHRDLKPGNVMITPEGRVKLLDFGLAFFDSARSATAATDASTLSVVTRPGGVIGTPAYLSPERVQGQPADARADVFAYGIVLYEMALGRHPFAGSNEMTTMANILHAPVEPLANVPPAFDAIVRRCLEKDPSARYQTTAALLTDLRGNRDTTPFEPRPLDRFRTGLTRRPVLVGTAAAVAGVAGWYAWRTHGGAPAAQSLAVLPAVNSGAEDYLAEGLTDSLINLLARAPRVRVLARSAVYNPQIAKLDPIAAGKRLGVEAVLTSQIRATAQTYRVAAELVEVATSRQLWGRTFDVARELVATIQNEIASPVLALLGGPQAASAAAAIPAEAYQACMAGRFHLNKRTYDGIEKSIGYFQEALAKKPDYALAWTGMAAAYGMQSAMRRPREMFDKALSAAQKAISLDANLPEAHSMLAWIRMSYNWDWEGAESGFRTALRLNPSYQYAHANYANLLVCRKRFDEAVASVQRAAQLDPLSTSVSVTLGNVYRLARRNDQAIELLTRLLEVEKRAPLAHFYRGTAFIQAGRYADAIRDFEAGLAMTADMGAVADLGLACARAGQPARAKEQIARIEQVRKERYVSPYYLAFPWIGLGDTDRAIDYLEEAAEDRTSALIYIGVEPKLDPLRNVPRFQRLDKLVGV